MKIDNTMLITYQRCPLLYKTRIKDWWTSPYASGALNHGQAMHAALAAWYQGAIDGLSTNQRIEAAVAALADAWPANHPVDDFRTKTKAVEVLVKYINQYPFESFQVTAVEVPFTFLLDRAILWCKSCETENPPTMGPGGPPRMSCKFCGGALEEIEYGGVIDAMTQFGAGSASVQYILEHKTTSELGQYYFVQWEIHNQVTGYCWGGQQASGKLIGGANVNVICLTRGGNIKFDRKMIGVNPSQIEEWKNDVARTCNEIAYAERNGHWRKSTDHCVTKYGTCQFHSVHLLSDPEDRRRRLETDYIKQEWDFERRDDRAPEPV